MAKWLRLPANAENKGSFCIWAGRIPWSWKWQPTQIFLPGKSHGLRIWQATIHGGHKKVGHDLVTKQQFYLVNLTFSMDRANNCYRLPENESRSGRLTLCDPMDCSTWGSSVHGILQARILEWVDVPFSMDLPTQGSNIGLPHCRWILRLYLDFARRKKGPVIEWYLPCLVRENCCATFREYYQYHLFVYLRTFYN